MSPLEDWWENWVRNLQSVAKTTMSLANERGAGALLQRARGNTTEERAHAMLDNMRRWDASAKGLYAIFNLTAAALGLRYVLTQDGPAGVCATDGFLKYLTSLNPHAVP
jgi:hypothetical protein